MAEKEHYVREISSFLSRTAEKVENVLSRLKWKKENLLKKVWICVTFGLFGVLFIVEKEFRQTSF